MLIAKDGQITNKDLIYSPTLRRMNNKQFVERLWRELINGCRLETLEGFVGPAFRDHTPLPGLPDDIEGMRQRLIVLHDAFPDFHSTILDLVAEGDKVFALVRSTGTHDRPFVGVPPTGRRFVIDEMHLLRLSGGQLVEHWGIPDFFAMLEQLGLVSAPWAAAAGA
jgi:predicted ester cyclase